MCNRYMMDADDAAIAARYGFDRPFVEPRTLPPPEIFPKKPALVVRQEGGVNVPDVMTWGFPHQVQGKSGRILDKPVTNVRNVVSSFWRSALANPDRRCLVPFTAFSEYGPTRGPDGKLPLRWFNVPSLPIVSFAGIWRPVEGGGRVYAFLTCEPNPLVAPIHPKAMPVLLAPEDEERWLTTDYDGARAMQQPFPSQLMRVDG